MDVEEHKVEIKLFDGGVFDNNKPSILYRRVFLF